MFCLAEKEGGNRAVPNTAGCCCIGPDFCGCLPFHMDMFVFFVVVVVFFPLTDQASKRASDEMG